MGFNIDLEKISLDVYEQILLETSLVPSRMTLREHADGYFQLLKKTEYSQCQ